MILYLVEDDAVEGEIDQADTFKVMIYAATAHKPTHHSPPAARVIDKLPKLAIRPFNSDITTRTTFWDSIESAIDSSTGLSKIDKFIYDHSLKSLLPRQFLASLSHLITTRDKEEIFPLVLQLHSCPPLDYHPSLLLLPAVTLL